MPGRKSRLQAQTPRPPSPAAMHTGDDTAGPCHSLSPAMLVVARHPEDNDIPDPRNFMLLKYRTLCNI